MKKYGLFVKIFIVMVICIVSVSFLITLTTIKMSERLFMDTFSITNHKIISQIKSNFESFSYAVVTATNDIRQSHTVKNFLVEEESSSLLAFKSYYQMHEQMTNISSNLDAYELSMVAVGVNGRMYSTNFAYWPISQAELVQHPVFENTYDEPKKIMYQLAIETNQEDDQPMIVASKVLEDYEANEVYGSLYIAIREKDFREFYNNYTSIGNDFFILNSNGEIISSNQSHWLGQKHQELLNYAISMEESGEDYFNANIFDKNQIVLAEYLLPFDMYIVNLIDKDMVMNSLIDTKTIVFISVGIVAVALLVVFLMSRRMTKSLRLLVDEISTISKNQFKQYLTVDSSYETRQISETFNLMLEELHEYVNKLVITQKKQRNAELEALQQQINPHFLYNTLASIKFMVIQGDKQKAEDTINALIYLLQNTIGNISETITVKQEIENIKNYVFINQVRHGNRIQVNYYFSPDSLSYRIPKLIIQPFIENAFFHGFNNKQTGHIRILIARKDHYLLCEVIDDGDGMVIDQDHQLLQQKTKRKLFHGIGVKNVHERLRLLYGEEYGVEISSELGEGTSVKIRLPLIKYENNPII